MGCYANALLLLKVAECMERAKCLACDKNLYLYHEPGIWLLSWSLLF